jgi:hypothetical protein
MMYLLVMYNLTKCILSRVVLSYKRYNTGKDRVGTERRTVAGRLSSVVI